jgi:hypothetical protein
MVSQQKKGIGVQLSTPVLGVGEIISIDNIVKFDHVFLFLFLFCSTGENCTLFNEIKSLTFRKTMYIVK